MKTVDKRLGKPKIITLDDLSQGECFEFNGDLYMFVSDGVVDIKSGVYYTENDLEDDLKLSVNSQITPVNVELHILP